MILFSLICPFIHIKQICMGSHYNLKEASSVLRNRGNCIPIRSTRVRPRFYSCFRVAQSLVFCVMFCRSLLAIILSSFFWPLYRLSFINLLFLITLLIFAKFSFCFVCRIYNVLVSVASCCLSPM